MGIYNPRSFYGKSIDVTTDYESDKEYTWDFTEINDNILIRELLIYNTLKVIDNLDFFICGYYMRYMGSEDRLPKLEKIIIETFGIKDFYPKISDLLSFEIKEDGYGKDRHEIWFSLGNGPEILNSMVNDEVFEGSEFKLSEIRKELFFNSGFSNPSKELSKFLRSNYYKKFINKLNDRDKLDFAIYRISCTVSECMNIKLKRNNYWHYRGDPKKSGYMGMGFYDIDNVIVEIWDDIEKKIYDLYDDDKLTEDKRVKMIDDEFVTIENGVMRLVNKWKENIKNLKEQHDILKNFHKKIELYAWANIYSIIKNESDIDSRLNLLVENKFLEIEENYTDKNLHLDFKIYKDQLYNVFGLNNETKPNILSIWGEKFKDFIKKLDEIDGEQISEQKRLEIESMLVGDNPNRIDKDDYLELIEYFKKRDAKMESKMLSMDQKIDSIKDDTVIIPDIKDDTVIIPDIKDDTSIIKKALTEMMSQIEEVKSLTKENNESIEKSINQILKIVEKNNNINDIVIEDYIPRIKKWFDFWELLEKDSKLFMPRSEYLYDSIGSSDFDDYSPFVLYYSRVLEVELFQKIFKKFGLSIREKYDDVSSLFEYDENISKKTKEDIDSGMINSFKNKLQKNDSKYNLGDMRLILDLLPDSKNPKGSKRYQAINALKELNIFINDEIGGIPKELITKIQKLISEYRNPSAHVGIINKKEAKTFFENYKNLMNELISLFNKNN